MINIKYFFLKVSDEVKCIIVMLKDPPDPIMICGSTCRGADDVRARYPRGFAVHNNFSRD